jgi:hypothetical protein
LVSILILKLRLLINWELQFQLKVVDLALVNMEISLGRFLVSLGNNLLQQGISHILQLCHRNFSVVEWLLNSGYFFTVVVCRSADDERVHFWESQRYGLEFIVSEFEEVVLKVFNLLFDEVAVLFLGFLEAFNATVKAVDPLLESTDVDGNSLLEFLELEIQKSSDFKVDFGLSAGFKVTKFGEN